MLHLETSNLGETRRPDARDSHVAQAAASELEAEWSGDARPPQREHSLAARRRSRRPGMPHLNGEKVAAMTLMLDIHPEAGTRPHLDITLVFAG